jgi:Xaa-Pro aminopeptidase
VSTGVSATRFAERLRRARAGLAAAGADALLIGVGPELEWLTGYDAHGIERLNLLVVPAAGPVCYISPRLEREAALAAPGIGQGAVEIVTWEETDDPFSLLPSTLPSAAPPRLLVSDGLRAAFLIGLQATLPDSSWGLASAVLAPLRRVKDAEEVALLEAAAAAADRAVEAIFAGPLIGRTEADVAKDVRDALVREGHDSADFWIVASGPNTASPHHEPSDRVIKAGEPLLLDIGGRRAGYCSDITRTVWIAAEDGAAPDPEFVTIYELTQAGQAAGRAAATPGTSFEGIDAAAREVITAGGYGAAFIHRLGHGIGIEVHEEPYVVAGNAGLAVAGNTFSVEPGIYLDGRFGVRIEDAVLCTADGGRALNAAPRGLRVISGR